MTITINEDLKTDDNRIVYRVMVNGWVAASSFDKDEAFERAYYIKLGAENMLKFINTKVTVTGEF